MEGCRYLQSQMEAEEADAEGKGMWVSCASNSLQSLFFFRVDLDTRYVFYILYFLFYILYID